MRLSNSHKAYVGVLGVALGALVVDSFVLQDGSTGPARAHAKPTPASAAPAAAAPAAPTATPVAAAASGAAAAVASVKVEPAAPRTPRLAKRLETLKVAAGPIAPGLLFAGAEQWLNPPERPAEAEGAAATPGAPSEPAPPPVPKHELTSVLIAGDRSCVILDGKYTLPIGGEHNGMRLIAVEPGSNPAEQGAAVFEWNGWRVRMVVQAK